MPPGDGLGLGDAAAPMMLGSIASLWASRLMLGTPRLTIPMRALYVSGVSFPASASSFPMVSGVNLLMAGTSRLTAPTSSEPASGSRSASALAASGPMPLTAGSSSPMATGSSWAGVEQGG
jgi:hypothetical protein